MLFPTLSYVCFFSFVLMLYGRLGHRRQNQLLLAASYFFYACWDYRFLSLLLFSTAFDFWAGLRIAAEPARARRLLAFSVAVNLGLLGVFKYYDFFAQSLQALSGAPLPLLQLVLPVGISFYTFQSLSYTIDVFRGETPARANFVDYALYVSFFPHLVAGPIQRANWLLPQIEQPRRVTVEGCRRGLTLLLIGWFRKVAIGDAAGILCERCFTHPGGQTAVQLAMGLCLFSLQIYGDFAGYSDMARGSAALMGFELTPNFRHPYFSASIREFWTRWHISLSQWLRDYLYIPLGGNRSHRNRNLLITMLLGGLWHGASWNFVVWGALHGLYLTVFRDTPRTVWGRAVGTVGTFALVTFTWLFFRLQDWSQIALYLTGLVRPSGGGGWMVLATLLLGGLTLAVDLPQARSGDECCFLRLPAVLRGILTALAILAILFLGGRSAPFLYFQF